MVKFKVFIKTMMFVAVVTAMSFVWYGYLLDGKQRAEASIPSLPNFENSSNQLFLDNVNKCVEYVYFYNKNIKQVNIELLLAQAALESGWGTSRFAKVGKNLFGIRTYDLTEPHMLPSNSPKKWGVKVFEHECNSVLYYIQTLNNHPAYKDYRRMLDDGIDDPFILVETLSAYASDKNYFVKIKRLLKKLKEEYK
jgi:uncharacterized FlgJ-related protein